MNIGKKIFIGLMIFPAFLLAVPVYADTLPANPLPGQPQTTVDQSVSFPYWPTAARPLISCSGDYSGYQNEGTIPAKTCTSLCDVIQTFQRILYFVMTLVLFIGAPLMFVVGGGMIFFAGASPSLLERGKKTVWAAVIGVVLALSAYVIIGTLLWLVGNDPSNPAHVSWPNISCDPNKMPGGTLVPWSGNAVSGPSGGGSGTSQ
ncbi:MAG: hypothetical protein V1856_00120 [Candidatus Liptonbacteria bacterium]